MFSPIPPRFAERLITATLVTISLGIFQVTSARSFSKQSVEADGTNPVIASIAGPTHQ